MPDDERLRSISNELLFTAFAGTDGRAFDSWVLERLLSLLDEEDVHAGRPLFRRGDRSAFIYFRSSGAIRMVREGAAPIVYEGRGILGVFDVLLERPRDRTAIPLTDMRLVKVRAEDWLELLEDSFDVARAALIGSARGLFQLFELVDEEVLFPANEVPAAAHLPAGPLNVVERTLALMSVRRLRGGGVQALANVAALSDEIRLEEGELLAARGEPRLWLTVVADGELVLTRPGTPGVLRFQRGAVLAPSVAQETGAASWEARASRPTCVLKIRLEDWLDEMEEHYDMVRATLATLADQTAQLVERIADRKGGLLL